MIGESERARKAIQQQFRFLFGDGMNTDFLSDNWTDIGRLWLVFPRIFALVMIKEGSISSVRDREGGGGDGELN